MLPDIWMAVTQHEPPPAGGVGRPTDAGDNEVLPLMLIRPVATIVTPISTGFDPEMLTSPAT